MIKKSKYVIINFPPFSELIELPRRFLNKRKEGESEESRFYARKIARCTGIVSRRDSNAIIRACKVRSIRSPRGDRAKPCGGRIRACLLQGGKEARRQREGGYHLATTGRTKRVS